MQDLSSHLSSRFVDKAESLSLHVESGWYVTKVSGTFVTGPHATEEASNRTFAAPKKK
jgi:hypothetical protein